MEALSLNGTDAAPPLARGRYRLLEELGHGGMAIVYRGHDERLSRDVAVKVLNPGLASNAVLRARFVQEARTMARLANNTRVVQIYDFGQDEDDQRLFIAMELLSGTVQQVLERHGPLPPRLASTIMVDVLGVLEVAHELRIIHRDVKPSNILLTREGSPKVGDFGIVRVLGARGQVNLTRTGAGVGTWAYMAPEQKRDSANVDHRADIYGVGATLFALLTNLEPHDIDRAETWQEQLEAIPAQLREVVLRATRYLPDERYDSATEMCAALSAILESLPPDPPEAGRLLVAPTTERALPSLPTLVPDLRPGPPARVAVPETTGTWPPPDLRGRPPLGLIVGIGAALTLLIWWLFWPSPPPTTPPVPGSQLPADDVVKREVAGDDVVGDGSAADEPSGTGQQTPEGATQASLTNAEPGSTGSTPDTAPGTPSGTRSGTNGARGAGSREGVLPETPPVLQPPPRMAQLIVAVQGSGACLVVVDDRRYKMDNQDYFASGLKGAPIQVMEGKRSVRCQDGPAQEILVSADVVSEVTLIAPTPSGP